VLTEAGAARNFNYFVINHAGNSMVKQELAARTIVVNRIPQTQLWVKHDQYLKPQDLRAVIQRKTRV
jgi:hypothetical protein